MLLFSLGQEFEHQREIEKMFDCFDRCSFPQIPSAYMLAAARYAYLWNRPDKGSLYLKTIAEAYFALGIAVDHFVYVRGLPFFGQTWQYLIAFAALQNDFTHTDEYFDRASQKLSDYDFDRSRVFYGCVKGNDYGPAIRELEEQLTAWDSRFPAGYQRVQLACLKARSAENPTEALGLLFNVAMGPNDFPWLKDVLTINRAWAHHRANDLAKEATEVDKFLRQQKLLFEPDHAVAFAFLPYQETLKSKYQHSTH